MADPTTLDARQLASAYRNRTLSPIEVAEAYLARIETGPVYSQVLADRAREQARRAEERLAAGNDPGPLLGIPVAIKDLFATKGTHNSSGSRAILENRPPAERDSVAAARLDAAGAVFLGRTTMTELAFSGLGVNPHFGTPQNVFDPEFVPGGSSSGSAVAVARGLAAVALGSDTGGSVRIPAAFNGLVGLKTSEGAIPTEGAVPLSFTLDTAGPIARTPEDAWITFNALAGRSHAPLAPLERKLRVMVPASLLDGVHPAVAQVFAGALATLEGLGHELVEDDRPHFALADEAIATYGSLAAHEANGAHFELLRDHGELLDPRVYRRIVAVADRPSSDYIRLLLERRRLRAEFWASLADFDLIAAPTVMVLPPRLSDLTSDEGYLEANRQVLRNTSYFNFLGGTAISVNPEPRPVGVMLAAADGNEALVTAAGRSLLPTGES